MKNYTREDLISLLDSALAYMEQPSLFSPEEVTDLLNEVQDAVDSERTPTTTWE